MPENSILVTPPSGNQTAKNLGQDVSSVKVASEHDVQMYYYVLSFTLKNYKMYKENRNLFKNTLACDRCYQLYSVKDSMNQHKSEDILICDPCFEHVKEPGKSNYYKRKNSVDENTGLRWIDYEIAEMPEVVANLVNKERCLTH